MNTTLYRELMRLTRVLGRAAIPPSTPEERRKQRRRLDTLNAARSILVGACNALLQGETKLEGTSQQITTRLRLTQYPKTAVESALRLLSLLAAQDAKTRRAQNPGLAIEPILSRSSNGAWRLHVEA